jgi:hypothetical protein
MKVKRKKGMMFKRDPLKRKKRKNKPVEGTQNYCFTGNVM